MGKILVVSCCLQTDYKFSLYIVCKIRYNIERKVPVVWTIDVLTQSFWRPCPPRPQLTNTGVRGRRNCGRSVGLDLGPQDTAHEIIINKIK